MTVKAFRPFQNGFRLIDGFKLNQLFSGAMSFVAAIVGGSINGTAIGATSPSTGSFTSLTTNGAEFVSPQILAAAGASQGNAALITKATVIVTVTASTEGVKLPVAATGAQVQIMVPGTKGVKVYPNTNNKISTAATNVAVALVADKANIYVAKDAVTWSVLKGA